MPRIYLWSASRLRNGIEDWKEITPAPLQKAVEALRRRFSENAWKVGEIMRQGCYPALHKGMADQARTINEGLKKLGYPALASVDEGQTEPTVFTACFDLCAELLAKEVRGTFSDLFDIASAQSALLSSRPVDWASLQTKVLVADESHGIPLWTKDACDKQPYDPSGNPDELIHWAKWRAPKWFFMQPFAKWPYDRATAWERMGEDESKHLLEVVEDRFNQRLIKGLEKAVDETHLRLAKQGSQSSPAATGVFAKRVPQVPAESVSKVGQVSEARSKADLWRDFHEKFQRLADEEQEQRAAQRDRFLRAYYTYGEHPEVFRVQNDARWGLALSADSDKLPDAPKTNIQIAAEGPFCLLETPDYGLWMLSDGIGESFRERFQTLATRAGVALQCPSGTEPLDFWLHRLLCDLRENRSKLLFADDGKNGIIVRLCEASAIFCSRLERKVLETSALVPKPAARTADGDLSERKLDASAARPHKKIDAARSTRSKNKRRSFVLPLLRKGGLSIHDWANKARVDFHTANHYLRGKTDPRPSTRKKLAESLGVEVEKLPR